MPLWRGFLVGTILLPLNALWVLYMEHIAAHGPIPSTISLFFNVVFVLFFLALGNALIHKLRPTWALNRGELIIVYVMLTTGTALAGLDGMQVLIPVMTHPFWFANPENRWDQLFADVPSWLTVSDTDTLYGYYSGSATLYQARIIHAWLTPALWWTGFIFVLVFVMICLAVLVRSQWADRERLTFPIIQLPLALTEPGTPLWRNAFLWIGFAAAGSIDLINGLHYLYPAVPYLSIAPTLDNYGTNDLMRYITDMPWAGIGWLPVTFYPAVIGICFLMPLDLLFACVFFFFWWKAMFVLAAALGVSQGYTEALSKSVFPYHNEQMFGSYLAIALAPILVGRRYFRHVWLRILGRPSEVDDSHEGLRYRTAAIGALLGIVLLALFSIRGGLAPFLAVLFFVMYYFVSLAVARVRAEFGSPVHDFHWAGPGQTITYIGGTANLRNQDLLMLSLLWWFNRAYRQHPIASSIEGVEMAARARSSARAVVAAILLATLLGAVAVFWGWLHYAYQMGVASGWAGGDARGHEMATNMQSWIESPTSGSPGSLFAIGAGFAITMLLAGARTAFVGWPLHPVAYGLSASWSIHIVWMPMLIAWLAKLIILRYGGLRLYRRVLPLFFGLILGEAVVGCAWPLFGLLRGVPTYSFWGL
ncbi:MAG: hypothetical protein OEV33_02970 [Armatimonadota bacterium]|nr:hypothetical protein [Armatimonadota bacterium]